MDSLVPLAGEKQPNVSPTDAAWRMRCGREKARPASELELLEYESWRYPNPEVTAKRIPFTVKSAEGQRKSQQKIGQ